MSTVIKDLGAVSAYAYAVEKGYTGTEAEFAELMADYAEVGERAEDAAESALNSKTAAQTAATTATDKASEATTAAQTATTKAGEASQSVSEANTAKEEAVTAQTAAETAQGKAEDAQAAAESVAESIPSDYSQLSEDVSDLKEDLNNMNTATSTDVGKALKVKTVTDGKVTEWEFGDAGSAIELDATLTDEAKAAQAKATGDAIHNIEDFCGYVTTLNNLPKLNGFINTSKKWKILTNYLHIIIPVNPNDVVSITTQETKGTTIAFLTQYVTPTDNGTVYFSSVEGFTSYISIAKNKTVTYTIPSDAYYVYVSVQDGTNNKMITGLTINGVDLTKTLIETVDDLKASAAQTSENTMQLDAVGSTVNVFAFGKKVKRGMINASSKKWANTLPTAFYSFYYVVLPVTQNSKIVAYGHNSYIAFLKSYATPTDGADADLSDADSIVHSLNNNVQYTFTVPSDCTFIYVMTQNNGTDCTPTITIDGVYPLESVEKNIAMLREGNGVNWCVMGDSISFGYYSYYNQDGTTTSATLNRENIGWAFLLAKYNNWNMTNISVAGGGYIDVGSVGADQTEASRGYRVARRTDFTPYNLVTISYGINDWLGNHNMGTIEDDASLDTQTTFIGAMKATIEAIIESNPHCKIIVILPTNGHWNGTYETNWCLEYTGHQNTGTLESFAQKMIEVCEYYGIQYIDMTHYSCINRNNTLKVTPDGLHPTIECHALLARELSRKITFS